ncbi:unnamed protein product, partial [Amoebophrya sp. A120]
LRAREQALGVPIPDWCTEDTGVSSQSFTFRNLGVVFTLFWLLFVAVVFLLVSETLRARLWFVVPCDLRSCDFVVVEEWDVCGRDEKTVLDHLVQRTSQELHSSQLHQSGKTINDCATKTELLAADEDLEQGEARHRTTSEDAKNLRAAPAQEGNGVSVLPSTADRRHALHREFSARLLELSTDPVGSSAAFEAVAPVRSGGKSAPWRVKRRQVGENWLMIKRLAYSMEAQTPEEEAELGQYFSTVNKTIDSPRFCWFRCVRFLYCPERNCFVEPENEFLDKGMTTAEVRCVYEEIEPCDRVERHCDALSEDAVRPLRWTSPPAEKTPSASPAGHLRNPRNDCAYEQCGARSNDGSPAPRVIEPSTVGTAHKRPNSRFLSTKKYDIHGENTIEVEAADLPYFLRLEFLDFPTIFQLHCLWGSSIFSNYILAIVNLTLCLIFGCMNAWNTRQSHLEMQELVASNGSDPVRVFRYNFPSARAQARGGNGQHPNQQAQMWSPLRSTPDAEAAGEGDGGGLLTTPTKTSYNLAAPQPPQSERDNYTSPPPSAQRGGNNLQYSDAGTTSMCPVQKRVTRRLRLSGTTRRNSRQEFSVLEESEEYFSASFDIATTEAGKLVPGDLIEIDAAQTVPCDCVVLHGAVVVNESNLTGEAMPIQKFALEETEEEMCLEKHGKKNILYAGTSVMQSQRKESAAERQHGNNSARFRQERSTARNLPGCIISAAPAQTASLHGSTTTADDARGGDVADQLGGAFSGPPPAIAVVLATGAQTVKGQMIRRILYAPEVRFELYDSLPYAMLLVGTVCFFLLFVAVFAQPQWQLLLVSYFFDSICAFSRIISPLIRVGFKIAQRSAANRMKSGPHCIQSLDYSRIPVAGKLEVQCFDKTGTLTEESLDFYGVELVAKTTSKGEKGEESSRGALSTETTPSVTGQGTVDIPSSQIMFSQRNNVQGAANAAKNDWTGLQRNDARGCTTVEDFEHLLDLAASTCHTVTRLKADNSLAGNKVECELVSHYNVDFRPPSESDSVPAPPRVGDVVLPDPSSLKNYGVQTVSASSRTAGSLSFGAQQGGEVVDVLGAEPGSSAWNR